MIVLVTGARGGIGSAIARALHHRGDRVVSIGRDQGDVADKATFDKHAPATVQALVAAAGVCHDAGDGETLCTNVLGSMRAAQAALARGARTIVLFSGGGVGGEPADLPAAYVASKAAVVTYGEWLAARTDAAVHVVAPGQIATRMTHGVGDTPDRVVRLVTWLLEKPRMHLSGRFLSAKWDDIDALADDKIPSAMYRLRRVDGDRVRCA